MKQSQSGIVGIILVLAILFAFVFWVGQRVYRANTSQDSAKAWAQIHIS